MITSCRKRTYLGAFLLSHALLAVGSAQAFDLSSLNGTFKAFMQRDSLNESGSGVQINLINRNSLLTFDGAGHCSYEHNNGQFTTNAASPFSITPDSTTASGSCTYTVNADGLVQILYDDGTTGFNTWIGSDGAMLIGGGTSTETANKTYTSTQMLAFKQVKTLTADSLAGNYNMALQGINFSQQSPGSGVGLTLFTGTGSLYLNGASCTSSKNAVDYSIFLPSKSGVSEDPSSGSNACNYSINPDGQSIQLNNDPIFWFNYDGTVAVYNNANINGYDSGQVFAVKAGTGMGVGTLNGTYRFVGQYNNFWGTTISSDSFHLSAPTGTFHFDGAGKCDFSVTSNNYNLSLASPWGVTVTPDGGSGSCTYTVSSNGGVKVKISDSDIVDFFANPSGSVLVSATATKTTDTSGSDYQSRQLIAVKVTPPNTDITATITTNAATKPAGYKGARGTLAFTLPTNATSELLKDKITWPEWVAVDPATIKVAKGKGSLSYTITKNDTTSQRTGVIQVASATYTVTQDGAPCTISSITASPSIIPAAGGTQTVTVNVEPNSCSWKLLSVVVSPAGQWFSDSGNFPSEGDVMVGDKTFTGSVTATKVARRVTATFVTSDGKSKKTVTVKQEAK